MGESTKIGFRDFQGLNLVVASVVEVRDHPNADKLLLMDIELGGGERRQLVAGLRGHYAAEDLLGRKIVVVENLEPATLRGERSEGMLLAATADDGRVVIIAPESDVPPGSKVS